MQTDTLTIKLLTGNLDENCMIRIERDFSLVYLGRIKRLPENAKELEVDKFKWNGRLKRWEVKIITKN